MGSGLGGCVSNVLVLTSIVFHGIGCSKDVGFSRLIFQGSGFSFFWSGFGFSRNWFGFFLVRFWFSLGYCFPVFQRKKKKLIDIGFLGFG
jgi:hypothetical protein